MSIAELRAFYGTVTAIDINFFRYKLVEGEGRNTTLKEDFLTTSYNPETIFIHLFLDLKVSFRDPPCINIHPDIPFHPDPSWSQGQSQRLSLYKP